MPETLRCTLFENLFESATRSSWTLINRISVDHQARLGARLGREGIEDLDVVICLNRINAAYTDFRRQWLRWKTNGAAGGQRLDALQALLDELSKGRIHQWIAAIERLYTQDSPQYGELLPDGAVPFQSGSIDDRLAAVEALSDRLADFSQLAELRNTVVAFHSELEMARGTEHSKPGVLDAASGEVEFARQKLAAALYANLGRLIEKHSEEPRCVAEYFDLRFLSQPMGSHAASMPVTAPIPAAVLAELKLASAN